MSLNGVLNVLKPPGMTSFDVVSAIRRILDIKSRAGHTGTLDPFAAGVLPVCTGKATKAVEYLTGSDKKYRAEITLGIVTDTYDSTGRIIAQNDAGCNIEDITKVLFSFKGELLQTPPMYSAVKVEGKRLYELARKGREIDRPPRRVIIYDIVLVDFRRGRLLFDVTCSKGTYIRSLCHEFGERLGCGAHLSFLVRTASGRFSINDSLTFEEIDKIFNGGRIRDIIKPVDSVLDFPPVRLDDARLNALRNGMMLDCSGIRGDIRLDMKFYKIYDMYDGFFGTAELRDKNGRLWLKLHKIFQ